MKRLFSGIHPDGNSSETDQPSAEPQSKAEDAMKNQKRFLMPLLSGASALLILCGEGCSFEAEPAKNAQAEITSPAKAAPKRESTGDAKLDAFLADFDKEHDFIYKNDSMNGSRTARITQIDEQIRRATILLDKHSSQSETRQYKTLKKRKNNLLGLRSMM